MLNPSGDAIYDLACEFIWGDRFPQPVALITHGGVSGGFGGSSVPAGESAYHYLHDVLGSVVALTNPAGQVVERYTYDPYGKTVIEATDPATGRPLRDPQTGAPIGRLGASGFGNPFAWTGQRYDAGVRLYHFLFRGYSPQLGRWLERDPAGYVGRPSLYEYVDSMVTYFIDPLGLQPEFPLSRRLKDLLDRARTETAQTGNEVGGVIFTKGSGLDGRRQIATDPATGAENKGPDDVMPDSSTQRGEEFRGTFHTHTVDTSFNPATTPCLTNAAKRLRRPLRASAA